VVAIEANTPILVGAGTAMQRFEDPSDGVDVIELMTSAARQALSDAGGRSVADRIGLVLAMKGMWRYADPAGLVASRLALADPHTVVVAPGVLQTSVFARALDDLQAGRCDAALVLGGEAKYRELRATITGTSPPSTVEPEGAQPNESWTPASGIIGKREIALRLRQATHHYAMIENARRALDGQSLDDHARVVARLWAEFNVIGRDNPQAWNRQPMTADEIRVATDKNRPLAFPYNKWHNSQWNVDQAGALLFTTVGVAESCGVPRDRWLFPHVIADSQHCVPVSERADIARSPGFRLAGRAAFAHAGKTPDDVTHIELYSCFPIAVRTQMLELGLAPGRQVTESGGMTWAGGPLNNWVVQALAKMADVLRADAGSRGLVTAISGMITKQGVSLWSTEPPSTPYRSIDVTDDVRAATPVRALVDAPDASATVATYTVLHDEPSAPPRGIVVGDLDDATRVLVETTDPVLVQSMMSDEWCGRRICVGRGEKLVG
jgi:acetyl-CoA C-acetyltransferase